MDGLAGGSEPWYARRVDRADFERLRDFPGKVIRGDIKFVQRKQMAPAFVADGIEIENSSGIALRLNINFNPDASSKTFNVFAVGIGPICRLDVDGPMHRPVGRSHKHSLQTERCPERNLPDQVTDRGDLSGKSLDELFGIFCKMAKVEHDGAFLAPQGS